MPIGNLPSFGGGASGSPDTAEQIRNKLQNLTGSDRLDASAIQNIDTGAASLLSKVKEVADAEGLVHGDAFSANGANDIISQLGVGATFGTAGSRVLPLYFNSNNNLGFFGGDGDDPTDTTSALIEIVIPKEFFTESQELRITTHSSSASGTRQIWAYNGDATSSGTEMLISRGNKVQENSTTPTTRYFVIPSGSEDIHVYISRQVLLDIALPNKSARQGAVVNSAKIAAAAAFASGVAGVGHDDRLGFADANASLVALGLNAAWRTDQGRIAPKLYATGGVYGFSTDGQSLDETGSAAISELVIPAYALQHNMRLEILRLAEISGGAGQEIKVYSGDPTSGGTLLSPFQGAEGTSTATVASTVAWAVSDTPTGTNKVTENLHICFKSMAIFSLDMTKVSKGTAGLSHVEELRGGTRPPVFDPLNSYSRGDRVFYTPDNLSYEALVNISPDPWDASQWASVSLYGNATRVGEVEDISVSLQDQIDVLRSGEAADYPDYDSSLTYNTGDKVTEPTGGIHAICLEDGVTGSFNPSKWDELSIENNAKPSVIRDRLERLIGSDRLGIDAIDLLEDKQVIYVSNAGDDANNGQSDLTPVKTLAEALALAGTLPNTSDRVIACLDASEFTENLPTE